MVIVVIIIVVVVIIVIIVMVIVVIIIIIMKIVIVMEIVIVIETVHPQERCSVSDHNLLPCGIGQYDAPITPTKHLS